MSYQRRVNRMTTHEQEKAMVIASILAVPKQVPKGGKR